MLFSIPMWNVNDAFGWRKEQVMDSNRGRRCPVTCCLDLGLKPSLTNAEDIVVAPPDIRHTAEPIREAAFGLVVEVGVRNRRSSNLRLEGS